MATKTHIAWSVAAAAFVAAMALGGAFYRTHQTNEKLEVTIAHLRAEQAKIGELSNENKQKLASEAARLERELLGAQNAQRELTDELFTAQEDIHALLEEVEASVPAGVAASEATASPFPAYLALKKMVLKGEPFHAEWEALQAQVPDITAQTKELLSAHEAGVPSLDTLKQSLRETHEGAHEVAQENPILSRLGGVISVRKLDKENDAIRDAVRTGDVKKAAALLRADSAYQDWLSAYDARRDILKALATIERGLAGSDG